MTNPVAGSHLPQQPADVVPSSHSSSPSRESNPQGTTVAVGGENIDSLAFRQTMRPEEKPELMIGLIGPIGVDLDPLIKALSDVLRSATYRVVTIRLSDAIQEVFGKDLAAGRPEHERIELLMNAGTLLREKSESGDAVAWLGVEQIAFHRSATFGGAEKQNAFILRSLKHPQEIERLRAIYGRGFIAISAYAPREVRVNTLAERFSRSQLGNQELSRSLAEKLIAKDEAEAGKKLGQDVKDAFPLADFFVDVRNVDDLKSEVKRFLELFLGNRFHTPSLDEHGMYHAKSAALRSADLNRQVGAAIMSATGDVLSLGCNDVPKAGGDQYWAGDRHDARDFKRGYDSSAKQRQVMLEELFGRLRNAQLLADNDANVQEFVEKLTIGERADVLSGASIMNLLEFGRSVHAEMAALMSAARQGVAVSGATLYSTTFPCHMCARHIVASGVRRVVYVEPYPKSRARQLHDDAIAVDPATPIRRMVNFEPFQGIAPRQYQSLFDAGDLRKHRDGTAAEWTIAQGRVRFERFLNTYREIELQFTTTLVKALRDVGVKYRQALVDSLRRVK